MADDPDASRPELSEPTRRFQPVRPGAASHAGAPAVPPQSADHASTPADEEALRWDGDDATERFHPAGPNPTVKPARRDAASGSALLIVYGAFGGIFLLMTIGWIATALRYLPTTDDPLAAFMQRVSVILAAVAPGAWLGLVFWLTRRRAAWQRITWLTLGILVVAPWPLISGSLG